MPILKEVLNDATIDEEFVMNVLGDLDLGGDDVKPERNGNPQNCIYIANCGSGSRTF